MAQVIVDPAPSLARDLRGARIAITGATGFVGHYLVDAFLARGATVVGVVRNPDKAHDLAERGVELRRADLADEDALAKAFGGADAVVANAALVSVGGVAPREVIATNVEGSARVLRAVVRAGVRRVAQVSSCTVYRRSMLALTAGDYSEQAPQRGAGDRVSRFNAYGVSKALAEAAARTAADEHDLAITLFRPTTIFGARDPIFLPTFRRLMRLPICIFPVGSRISLVYAGDVADAIARAIERDASAGTVYNLGGDDTTLWALTRLWRELGQRSPFLQIPFPFPLNLPWDSSRARRELGWQPRALRDALVDTFAREAAGR